MIAWRSGISRWTPRSRRSVATPAATSRMCSSHGGRAVLSRANLVLSGLRSRSPLVEHACAVLIWARTRSLDGLISAIDDVLLPVGEAQLQVEEESLVTLTQQRAVTFAMSALMTVMFVSLVRVASFRAYYDTVRRDRRAPGGCLRCSSSSSPCSDASPARLDGLGGICDQVQEQELHPHG